MKNYNLRLNSSHYFDSLKRLISEYKVPALRVICRNPHLSFAQRNVLYDVEFSTRYEKI